MKDKKALPAQFRERIDRISVCIETARNFNALK